MLLKVDSKKTKPDLMKKKANCRIVSDCPKSNEMLFQKVVLNNTEKEELKNVRSRWRAEDTAAQERKLFLEKIESDEQKSCFLPWNTKNRIDKKFDSNEQNRSLLISDKNIRNVSLLINGRIILFKIPPRCEETLEVPISDNFEKLNTKTSPLRIITTRAVGNDIKIENKILGLERFSSAVRSLQHPKNLISSDDIEIGSLTARLNEREADFKQHKTISNPVTLIKPVPPVKPVKPVASIKPVELVKPVESVNPVVPVKPVNPVCPIIPVVTVNPVYPVTPVAPVNPVIPVAPVVRIRTCAHPNMSDTDVRLVGIPVNPVNPVKPVMEGKRRETEPKKTSNIFRVLKKAVYANEVLGSFNKIAATLNNMLGKDVKIDNMLQTIQSTPEGMTSPIAPDIIESVHLKTELNEQEADSNEHKTPDYVPTSNCINNSESMTTQESMNTQKPMTPSDGVITLEFVTTSDRVDISEEESKKPQNFSFKTRNFRNFK
jgi:hypothetical protein